jgi:hypothetical protein
MSCGSHRKGKHKNGFAKKNASDHEKIFAETFANQKFGAIFAHNNKRNNHHTIWQYSSTSNSTTPRSQDA